MKFIRAVAALGILSMLLLTGIGWFLLTIGQAALALMEILTHY